MKRQLKMKTARLLVAILLLGSFNIGILSNEHVHEAHAATKTCPTCNGTAVINCPKNGGHWYKDHGDGTYHTYSCEGCNEAGKSWVNKEESYACFYCDGSGKTGDTVGYCSACSGSGYVTKEVCTVCGKDGDEGWCWYCTDTPTEIINVACEYSGEKSLCEKGILKEKCRKCDGWGYTWGRWEDCFNCEGVGKVYCFTCKLCKVCSDSKKHIKHTSIDCPTCINGTIEVTPSPTPEPSRFSVYVGSGEGNVYFSSSRSNILTAYAGNYEVVANPADGYLFLGWYDADNAMVYGTDLDSPEASKKVTTSLSFGNGDYGYYAEFVTPTPTPTSTPTQEIMDAPIATVALSGQINIKNIEKNS